MTNPAGPSRTDRTLRIVVYAAVALSLAIGGALILWKPQLERWIANNVTEVGGPFELVDQDGKRFTRDDLLGHPHIIYFGFTLCPDLCPTTLFQLASIVDDLGEAAAPLKVVFITVDPERDTVPILKDYVSAFRDDFIGLTGPQPAIERAAKAYHIYYAKVPLDDGGYTMDHTASAMLFDANGSYVDSVGYNEDDTSARMKIERLLAATASP